MLEPKRCPRCATLKPRSEFHRNARRADGLNVYCRSCRSDIDHAEYERTVGRSVSRHSRTAYAFARGAWLRSLKADHPCTDCGRIFDPPVMQWDHLPGFEKRGHISDGFAGCTEEEILSEIAKCELVCTNCHTLRTFQRNGWDARWRRDGGDAARDG